MRSTRVPMQGAVPTPAKCRRGASVYPRPVAEALKTTGAEDIRWDLSELYRSPTDPAIEERLAASLEAARRFEQMYKGRISGLSPTDFAAMMQELEDHYDASARPGLYAHLLHTQDTADPAAGRLVARVREAGAERGRHLVFFALEMAQIDDEQASRLYADPAA